MILICLSVIGIIAVFYYVVGGLLNISVGILHIVYDKTISPVLFVPSFAGIVAGSIASLYFQWLSIWWAISLAILPDAFCLLSALLKEVILCIKGYPVDL